MSGSLTPGTTLSRYRVLSKIGEGGMGEVYLAEDTTLTRKVALKILPEAVASDRSRMARFIQEAKAASALNHPNILTIHEIGQSDSIHFIATEYVEGQTLRTFLSDRRPSLDERLGIAVQIAGALAAAHQARIIHRDIKPDNVMVRPDGIVKIVDFGLAKLAVPPSSDTDVATQTGLATNPGSVLGTVAYMSPEQARGREIDARTDIFSLGVVLYEMFAGCIPFDGPTPNDAVAALLSEKEPAPLARYARDLPFDCERVVAKALRKDPEQRYQSARELAIDLQDLRRRKSIEPSSGVAASSGGHRASWRQLLVLAAGVLAMVAGGFVWYQRAQDASPNIDSIAVLPFANQNRDPENEYLADGLAESIINNLAQLPDLRVIARNSAFRYKGRDADALQVGRELHVRAVMVGRVIQHGQELSVSAELVDARDNRQLWGQQYNRRVADVFAIQEEIAREISERLRAKLNGTEPPHLGRRPTDNLKAFRLYMQGRDSLQRRTRADLLNANEFFEKAIAEDRNYALAYTGMAEAYVVLGARGYISPQEGRRKAQESARQALALDDMLAEAHLAVSQPLCMFPPYDFPLVDRELRRALELSPGLAMAYNYQGMSYARQGRFDASIAFYAKSRQSDPLSAINARASMIPVLFKRDYAQARDGLREANELGPRFIVPFEIAVYVQNQMFAEAISELDKAQQDRPNDPLLIYSRAAIDAAQGRRANAVQAIRQLEQMSGETLSQAHWIAKIHAALNETEPAISWLERGFAAGAIADFFKDEPVWDSIRADPRFVSLLRQMGVPIDGGDSRTR